MEFNSPSCLIHLTKMCRSSGDFLEITTVFMLLLLSRHKFDSCQLPQVWQWFLPSFFHFDQTGATYLSMCFDQIHEQIHRKKKSRRHGIYLCYVHLDNLLKQNYLDKDAATVGSYSLRYIEVVQKMTESGSLPAFPLWHTNLYVITVIFTKTSLLHQSFNEIIIPGGFHRKLFSIFIPHQFDLACI